MHAILTSIGTAGDVYPFIGLGSVLRSRGHRATVVVNEHFRDSAIEQGLEFRSLLSRQEMDEALQNPDFWHPMKAAWVISRWGASMIGRQYKVISELASDRDAVLVASVAVAAARVAQEKLGRPAATIILQPWVIPSLACPPVMPAGLTLPRWAPRPLGKLYFRALDAVGDLLVGPNLNRLRASVGLGPVRRLFRWWFSPELVIGMFPQWYGPPQSDWPPQIRLSGFGLFDGHSTELAPDLREFCRGGQCIAFTFGTGMMHAAHLFRASVEACRILGMRGILLTRFTGQLPASLPDSIRHVEFAPFQKLFPLCAAVVHHGGVGTVAKALSSGTPQLVLPFCYDQIDNAVRAERLGAGAWLPPRRRTARHLATALAPLLTPESRSRCRSIAGRLSGHNAFETAADWVEDLAERRSRQGLPYFPTEERPLRV